MSISLPQFFNYEENKVDNGYEALHDFFLSWTLRCAVDQFVIVDEKVQNYAKQILLHLLFNDAFRPCKINSIKTKKQLGYIDLLAEITILNDNNVIENYVLNIENKWYSRVSDSQLKKYSNALADVYSNSNYKIISVVLFPDYTKLEENRAVCNTHGYRMETFDNLKALIENKPFTGNDLFDEFWFKFY